MASNNRAVFYTPEFKRNLRTLSKKYRRISEDVQPVIDQLAQGVNPGDRVPGIKPFVIFKVRVRNSDLQKGKSSGYRIIYYLRNAEACVLVTIYSKLEQSDVSTQQVKNILSEFSATSN
jgi:mRNA-degrading endonuclease RelE of RelBE toxin-antitoxin system